MTAALLFHVRSRKYLVKNHQSGILTKSNEPLSNLHQIFIKPTGVNLYFGYSENVKKKTDSTLLKIKVFTMKSPLNLVKALLAVAGIAALSAVSAAPASAFSFSNITGGDTAGDAYSFNFGYNVVDQGDSVLFNIFNYGHTAAPSMFISKVFFDDDDNNNYLSAPSANVNNDGQVRFVGGAGNDQLPQGGNNFTTNYAFSRDTGEGNVYGIQALEKLGLAFRGDYDNVIAGLTSGNLKLGLHVQALPNGASDSYISSNSGNTQDTPEPLTMLAAGAAVGFGTMFKKQRDRVQKAE